MIGNKLNHYDIIIVGAGPGGLFAAYEIVEGLKKNANILIIDKGKTLVERNCQVLRNKCINCKKCELISGGGGAGLFSDGKLVFDLYSGGYLKDFLPLKEKENIENKIRNILDKFSPGYIYKKSELHTDKDFISFLDDNNLKFKSYPVIHLGSANLRRFTSNLISYLQRHNVKFLFNTEVSDIKYKPSSNQWYVEVNSNVFSKKIDSQYVVMSVGKEGNFWFSALVERLSGEVEDNNVYMGVRMEINDSAARHLYNLSLDPKFSQYFGNIKIKTHCFCRHGEILLLKYFGLPLAGGHSPFIEIDESYNSEKFENSNFAILYRDKKNCTRKKAIEIMEKINKITGGNLLVQRLGDYLNNIPTTSQKLNNNSIKPSNLNVTPGCISEDILPGFRDVFISFLKRLSSWIPDIINHDNLLYAPAIEWWMRKIKVDKNMGILNLQNIYAIGDGSGWTQGIVQSAATGIIAARNISEKIQGHGAIQIDLIKESEENAEKRRDSYVCVK